MHLVGQRFVDVFNLAREAGERLELARDRCNQFGRNALLHWSALDLRRHAIKVRIPDQERWLPLPQMDRERTRVEYGEDEPAAKAGIDMETGDVEQAAKFDS